MPKAKVTYSEDLEKVAKEFAPLIASKLDDKQLEQLVELLDGGGELFFIDELMKIDATRNPRLY